MKNLTVFVLSLLILCSCDYKVALVENPAIKINRKLVGTWERINEGGNSEKLVILPLSEYEYLIVYPQGSDSEMYAKAVFYKDSKIFLVQLQWFGNAKGETNKDGRVYQYAKYSLNGEELKVSLLNTKVVSKDIADSKRLIKLIAKNLENPKLFNRPMKFSRTKKKADILNNKIT